MRTPKVDFKPSIRYHLVLTKLQQFPINGWITYDSPDSLRGPERKYQ